jgi:hypothetical protein
MVEVVRRRLIESTGNEHPFGINEYYYLVQGVDLRSEKEKQKSPQQVKINVGAEEEFRLANPLISLAGAWGMPGHIGMGDALLPKTINGKDFVYIAGGGMRVDDLTRNPEKAQALSVDDFEVLEKMMNERNKAQKEVRDLRKEQEIILKEISDNPDKKSSLEIKIETIDNKIKAIEDGKNKKAKEADNDQAPVVAITRPLPGYEAFKAGTVFEHSIVLQNVTPLELGIFLNGINEFSRNPYLG